MCLSWTLKQNYMYTVRDAYLKLTQNWVSRCSKSSSETHRSAILLLPFCLRAVMELQYYKQRISWGTARSSSWTCPTFTTATSLNSPTAPLSPSSAPVRKSRLPFPGLWFPFLTSWRKNIGECKTVSSTAGFVEK